MVKSILKVITMMGIWIMTWLSLISESLEYFRLWGQHKLVLLPCFSRAFHIYIDKWGYGYILKNWDTLL